MSHSESSSASSSISLIKLDELSSFGATRQNRLPALIKLNQLDQNPAKPGANSMPNFSSSSLEPSLAAHSDPRGQQSLPSELVKLQQTGDKMDNNKQSIEADKENLNMLAMQQQHQHHHLHHQETGAESLQKQVNLATDKPTPSQAAGPEQAEPTLDNTSGDFQVVDMEQVEPDEQVEPSLPQLTGGFDNNNKLSSLPSHQQLEKSIQTLQASQLFNQQQPSSVTHLGDSLIEMIINLRNENQNLIRALEANNDYVKERLSEFKKAQEESRRREIQFAVEKAEHEHQIRKLQRQNNVLSDRLKSMESKLKEMKSDVIDTLDAAHSSKASSIRQPENNLYPELATDLEAESFSNSALNGHNQAPTTMQIDATSGELYNQGDRLDSSSAGQHSKVQQPATAPQMDTEPEQRAASRVANMTKDQLEKHFDAEKVKFYALDDPMQQCDKLEQQLNDIGKRDYEICLLQQQLNIYRQDFRLERMANLEAKIQIEKLKNDIDKLCLERLQDRAKETTLAKELATGPGVGHEPQAPQDNLIGRLGRKAAKSAARSAAKAAKYAAKQAHLEEKAAKAMARMAGGSSSTYTRQQASTAAPGAQVPPTAPSADQTNQYQPAAAGSTHHQAHYGHHRHHQHHRPRGGGGIRSEMVNDLLSTANKAMLTGYKMASTHVNLALDKLSQYEQEQRDNLEKAKQQTGAHNPSPSAPQMQPPSMD